MAGTTPPLRQLPVKTTSPFSIRSPANNGKVRGGPQESVTRKPAEKLSPNPKMSPTAMEAAWNKENAARNGLDIPTPPDQRNLGPNPKFDWSKFGLDENPGKVTDVPYQPSNGKPGIKGPMQPIRPAAQEGNPRPAPSGSPISPKPSGPRITPDVQWQKLDPKTAEEAMSHFGKVAGREGLIEAAKAAVRLGGPSVLRALGKIAAVSLGPIGAAALILPEILKTKQTGEMPMSDASTLPPANMTDSADSIIPPESAPAPLDTTAKPPLMPPNMPPAKPPLMPPNMPPNMPPAKPPLMPPNMPVQAPPDSSGQSPTAPNPQPPVAPPQGSPQASGSSTPPPNPNALLAAAPTPQSASMANPGNAPSTPMMNKGNRAAQVAVQEDFRIAFKNARAKLGNNATFEWPQGSGNIYTTKLKGE